MWNIFRTCGRDDQQGAVAGDYIAQRFRGKKVAILHDRTTYGQGLADETKKTMNSKGVQEVLYEGINKVISVPSTPGPPMVANSSEVMPSPPISGALTPWSRICRTIRPPSVCSPPQ